MNIAERLRPHFAVEIWSVFEAVAKIGDRRRLNVALVGGVIRDLLLDRSMGDADIMAEHPAKEFVAELAMAVGASIVSHERFFTFTITLPSGKHFDIVTAREERYAAPAKLPDVSPSTIERDLKRRDFTINAIACRLNASSFGELLDPFDGRTDMERKVLRALHEKSFVDDPTRIYRAARFAGRLGFVLEKTTEQWIRDAIAGKFPDLLSPVRRRHEFQMILKEKDPLPALWLLKEWNALRLLHSDFDRYGDKGIRFGASTALEDRLLDWFAPFGRAAAEKMMGDLQFEKVMKSKILSKLVQSSTNS